MNSIDTRDVVLNVPHISQRLDVDGRWLPQHRACGMVSAYMALRFYQDKELLNKQLPELDFLIAQGIEEKGLLEGAGWVHDYLVRTFHRYGIHCKRFEGMDPEKAIPLFVHCLADCEDPVLVSAQHTRFGPGDTINHIILLTGVRHNEDGKPAGFFYHDCNVYRRGEGIHDYVSFENFLLGWKRRAILPCTKM